MNLPTNIRAVISEDCRTVFNPEPREKPIGSLSRREYSEQVKMITEANRKKLRECPSESSKVSWKGAELTPLQAALEDERVAEAQLLFWQDQLDTRLHIQREKEILTQLGRLHHELYTMQVNQAKAPLKIRQLELALERVKARVHDIRLAQAEERKTKALPKGEQAQKVKQNNELSDFFASLTMSLRSPEQVAAQAEDDAKPF